MRCYNQVRTPGLRGQSFNVITHSFTHSLITWIVYSVYGRRPATVAEERAELTVRFVFEPQGESEAWYCSR